MCWNWIVRGLGLFFYTMPSTLLSAPSWSLWQMAETRHCVRVCVWHLRFLSLYLRVCWHNVKQKKKLYTILTLFFSVNYRVWWLEKWIIKCLRLQHSQRSKEKRKSRTGSIDEGIWDKKSLLPSRHFPLCLEITPIRFFPPISHRLQLKLNLIFCANSSHLPLSALPNAHSSWWQGDRIFKWMSSWSQILCDSQGL